MPQRLLHLILLLTLPLALPAQQSTNTRVLARAELGRTEITIGDQVSLEVNISAPPNTTVFPLASGYLDGAPGLEVIEEKDLNEVAKTPELLLQQRLVLTSFDTGYVSVPPLPFLFKAADGRQDTSFTNALVLRVNLLPVGDDEELRPIKDIIREPRNIYDFWPLFLIAILVAIGFVTYQRFQASRRVTPPPPPPPADLQALNALKQLEQEGLWEKGDTKQYYTRLTNIFRTYLTSRFKVPAMEMTSRQINTALSQKSRLDVSELGEIKQLLQLSDLVKFAKATPAAELHVAGLERVRSFVRRTGPEEEKVESQESGIASGPVITPARSASSVTTAAPGLEDRSQKSEGSGEQAVPQIQNTENEEE